MANREACELYIEQEIEEGLQKGKTPYSIGQELSKWVVKYFEVRISPHTLRSRAQRYQKKFDSNESKKSNNQRELAEIGENERIEKIPSDYPKTERGGKREGAGRPTLEQESSEIIDKAFLSAFKLMRKALYAIRREKWITASRNAVIQKLQFLLDIALRQ